MTSAVPLTDAASVLVSLGAICGLAAALYWFKVRQSIGAIGEAAKGPDKRHLATAATFTAIALALACGGYLLGRFTGRL